MDKKLTSFDELINEITDFTGLNKEKVKKKVWMEALNPGWNVKKDAQKFGIDFHNYNEKMEIFYKESYGFIFETSVESYRNGKHHVLEIIKSRILNFLHNKDQKINILMLGDGIGRDTVYLYSNFHNNANFFYFDVPGSKTYDFAMKRFQKHNIVVNLINNYDDISANFFDIIVCLEVLEHLPDPQEAMKNISKFLKLNGIVLITESFSNVSPNFPTHLKSNVKYAGRTPFLFSKYDLILNYYSKESTLFFRPTEYIKKNINLKDRLNLYFDKYVLISFVFNKIKNIGW